MKFATRTIKTPSWRDALRRVRTGFGHDGAWPSSRKAPNQNAAAFTLVEVLAALLFMAIVIPVAVGALRVASLAGEVAARKAGASRVADRVLNEAIVTGNWNAAGQGGTVSENGRQFRWTLRNENWPVTLTSTTALTVVTAEVTYSAQGRDFAVHLSTLVLSQ